jgi:hypothetical protein
MPADKRKSMWLFAALCVVCVTATGGYVWQTRGEAMEVTRELPPMAGSPLLELAAEAPVTAVAEAPPAAEPTETAPEQPEVVPAPAAPAAPAPTPAAMPAAAPTPAATPVPAATPLFLLRHTGVDKSYGRLAAESGSGETATREATPLTCERVHFAAGRGVCLEARRGAVTTYSAILFDAAFKPAATLPLTGIPSRTRVSSDGRYAAFTVFVSGHSYGSGGFSTATQIIDAANGAPVVANLEQMEVWSGGARWQEVDFNFWGVTFTRDSNRFYATLGTGGRAYLVQGDIAANKLTVIKEGIECPSISPDNTRVAFKKRVPGTGLAKWRIAVLDLATLTETLAAEDRFVDEQLVWLDDQRILYTQASESAASRAVTDVWVVPADGSGTPSLLLREAASPTPLRAGNSVTE